MTRRVTVSAPLRYIIAAHRRREGVTLSKVGHWGGIPHPDDATAEAAARDDARGSPLSIERVRK